MTNYECEAYAALAMERAGVPAALLGAVLSEFTDLFDRVSEAEAVELASPIRNTADRAYNTGGYFR